MTDPMLPNEALQSQLSAFVDDALPSAEIDLFARRLVKDAELKHTMSRYSLIGEALRAPDTQTHVSRDFSARVAAALDQQQLNTNPVVTQQSTGALAARWLKPAAGLAIAASVAWVAVLTVQSPAVTPTTSLAMEALQPVTLTAQQFAATSDSYVVPAAATAPSAAIPAARLTNYVVAHSEYSSPLGRHNMMTGLLTESPATEEVAAADTTSEP